MTKNRIQPSMFGYFLRQQRRKLGLSQLALAAMAKTTPRYISFLETGRSRPSKDIIVRIAEHLRLDSRETYQLLVAAGRSTPFFSASGSKDDTRQLDDSIRRILDSHNPYPGCAVDVDSRILRTNSVFERTFPGLSGRSAIESIDDFFRPGQLREYLDNWPDLAWDFIDRRKHEAARESDFGLIELSERAESNMKNTHRRPRSDQEKSIFLKPRLNVGDQIISTYVAILRFESADNFGISGVRLELLYPDDSRARSFFESLASSND